MPPSARPPRAWLPQDVAALQALYAAALRNASPALPESFIEAEVGNLAQTYLPQTDTRVIGHLGAPVGFLSLNGNEIAGLFIHPDSQRNGIGTALLAWAADQTANLEAEVFAENTPARRFYEANGFTEIAKAAHPETGLPLLRLRR
ncbi:GNAT family N-acetyltransferase [Pseudoruegeria sp. SHC-113]|uniref:GNAT family N-acetyltransferase n=1 Tax=Pseudoruegeria sp. SHC-113 TaxID=2855439 RepID=UPI0021BB878A|nr:GNAT family N-acetyltransferase [Pseudoruegeria sp. SHC-113]MCT8161550.1 GNAT family N-acetyltransferase [Pseudoruegeria sp. SHC-113]